MSLFSTENETICAQSTARGFSGISVVRVSGPRALEVSKNVCKFLPGTAESHRVYYGFAEDESGKFDEVLTTYFNSKKSFTGEDVVEISGHGNPVLVDRLLQSLVKSGARPAEAGEFTYRAFLNGRIDLVQAESVLGMIESRSKKAGEVALRQLEGGLSKELEDISENLVSIAAHLEANIDYAAEDIVVEESDSLVKRAEKELTQLSELLASYNHGRKVNDGLRVSLMGLPNSGKSSLLNTFLKENTAIVSDTPGTTRDVVTGEIVVSGHNVKLFDTAGIRETVDEIESIGVKKAWEVVEKSDEILYLVDGQKQISDEDILVIEKADRAKINFVFTKTDLLNQGQFVDSLSAIAKNLLPDSRIYFSSVESAEECKRILESLVEENGLNETYESESLIVSRHYDELSKSKRYLEKSIDLLERNESPEFVAFELKQAILSIYRTTGKEFDDQIMDKVFSQFCLGK